VGRGKVEIQKQDFHFPTAPIACGARKKPNAKGEKAVNPEAVYTNFLTSPDQRFPNVSDRRR
jgi:hypothetical protein